MELSMYFVILIQIIVNNSMIILIIVITYHKSMNMTRPSISTAREGNILIAQSTKVCIISTAHLWVGEPHWLHQ